MVVVVGGVFIFIQVHNVDDLKEALFSFFIFPLCSLSDFDLRQQ